jgi:hypothetical protein
VISPSAADLAVRIRRAQERDACLNSEEAAVRTGPTQLPEESLAQYQDLLQRAGWDVHLVVTSERTWIEGARDQAAVLVARRPRQHRCRLYVLRPPLAGPPGWLQVRPPAFEAFALRLVLPDDVRAWRPFSKCQCGQIRYPTRQRAEQTVARARGERRAYRCRDDFRTWHTTSQVVWPPARYLAPEPS